MHINREDGFVARARKPRICREFEGLRVFIPCGMERDEVRYQRLAFDQLEALCLCDLEGMTQEEAGERMGVSRGTVQRLVTSARRTVAMSLLHSHALVLGRETDPSVLEEQDRLALVEDDA